MASVILLAGFLMIIFWINVLRQERKNKKAKRYMSLELETVSKNAFADHKDHDKYFAMSHI